MVFLSRIVLIGENSIAYINTLLDIWNNGDCAVLIDWRIPLITATEMMKEAGVSECYIQKNLLEKSSEIHSTDIKYITFNQDNAANLLPNNVRNKFIVNYSKDEAVILYSSGTTGKSKGIILSHYAINKNADAIIDYMQPQKNDCMYIIKTLSHSSTLIGELLVALRTEMKLLVSPTIVPPRYIFNNIRNYQVSIICMNPTLLNMYANEYQQRKYDISSLKNIYVSGSILNDKIYQLAHKVFKNIIIYNVYGLSEAGPRVAAQRVDCCKGNSVGKPIKFVELVIVDENGKVVENGEPGIIHINTPCKFSGYVFGEEKNESLYKGWLNTGDIGYFDNNEELHIIDRLDDVIIVDSHKIYPSEIERKIIDNTPIRECVIVKEEINNTEFIACLYAGNCYSEKIIKEKLKKILLPYEIPRRFIHSSAIPRTNNGKISKTQIKSIIKNIIME